MHQEIMIQKVLDEIDKRIKENLQADKLAELVNYSTDHLRRIFVTLTGIPIMSYITQRKLEYGAALSTLHDTYPRSHHCEVAVCFDIDVQEERFTYMLGVGVDDCERETGQRPGTYLHQIRGGLYAVFTTPQVEEARYVQSIHDTWKEILTDWLPRSEYEYDDTREEFEYYDERDHGDKPQMDICIPVKKKE